MEIPRFKAEEKSSKQKELEVLIDSIKSPSKKEEEKARIYNDTLCKPLGSLGIMEDIFIRIHGIFKDKVPEKFKKAVVVYSSDNGICEEGISSNPQDITHKICLNILSGGSGLCRIANFYGVDVELEDIGVLNDVEGHTSYKVRYGTKNASKCKAMTYEDAISGILAGAQKTEEMINKGYNLLGFGEMGVGNTSTSSAVISAFTGERGEITVGMGSGLTEEAYLNKIRVVNEAILVNSPFKDPVDVLSSVGGLDICAMVGSYLKCAQREIPFVLDGVISMAALLAASALNEKVLNYAFSSHVTVEQGARLVEKKLGLKPPLNLGLRLGEGSGCPMGMSIIEASIHTLKSMATFKDVSVDKNDYVDIRKGVEKNEKSS